jgi:transposase
MQIQEQIQKRKAKGFEIAKSGKVKLKDKVWLVPSQSSNKYYSVTLKIDKSECNCPDFVERGLKCKHIFAVEITITKEINGSETKITKKITYSQNWSNYDKAQTQQKELFMKLLFELCQTIPIEQIQVCKGRPKASMRDMVFDSALKVYTTFSLRRFMTDIKTAKELGYVELLPHFSLVSKYMMKEELTPILNEPITLSSLPLRSVETKFAVDSSGFRTSRYSQYMRVKYDMKEHKEHEWIKSHICCGVKTNIITAVEISGAYKGDSTKFVSLVANTHNSGFRIEEVSADKAYSSKDNLAFVNAIDGIAFIPFKSNAVGNSYTRNNRIWRKMYDYFTFNREEFLEHYHKRSNVESTFNMLKTRFNDYIKSKDQTAQINELLLKVLCHNICVLVSEMFELNIPIDFSKS